MRDLQLWLEVKGKLRIKKLMQRFFTDLNNCNAYSYLLYRKWKRQIRRKRKKKIKLIKKKKQRDLVLNEIVLHLEIGTGKRVERASNTVLYVSIVETETEIGIGIGIAVEESEVQGTKILC